MTGTVFLKTNRFEVKLEGITFKTRHFEALCKMDFLFPEGKVWAHPPIVGLDVMRHPRDPSILLVLLCFGVGCIILRFSSKEPVPSAILKFLSDKRIHFVGFGIPEKNGLFPFKELGLSKRKMDIGYLAANILKDSKYKRWELAELARKVIGIKRMIGLTESSSFERHEQIKCAICQLFITSVIAMGLLGANEKIKRKDSSISFLKNLSSVQLLAEGLFKLPTNKKHTEASDLSQKSSFLKSLNMKNLNSCHPVEEWFKLPTRKKKNENIKFEEEQDYIGGEIDEMLGSIKHNHKGGCFGNYYNDDEIQYDDDPGDDSCRAIFQDDFPNEYPVTGEGDKDKGISQSDSSPENCSGARKPLKGILKCSSTTLTPTNLTRCNSSAYNDELSTSESDDQMTARAQLRRANSKGCNVSFKCQ